MNKDRHEYDDLEEESIEIAHVLGMCSPDDPDYARQQRILRETKKYNPEQYQKFLDMK